MPGALTFGAATSNRADSGAITALNSRTVATYWAWVYPITLTATRVIWGKATATLYRRLFLNGTGGNLQFAVARATTSTNYVTSNTPLATLNRWYYVLVTFDTGAGAGEVVNIYVGGGAVSGPGTLATECTYGTATDGAGAITDDSTATSVWGNTNAATVAFQGRIAMGGIYGSVLTLAQGRSIQRRPRKTIDTLTALEFKRFGKNGADGIDYTGNANSTVTGATQSDGVPLDQGDLSWQRDTSSGLFSMAA